MSTGLVKSLLLSCFFGGGGGWEEVCCCLGGVFLNLTRLLKDPVGSFVSPEILSWFSYRRSCLVVVSTMAQKSMRLQRKLLYETVGSQKNLLYITAVCWIQFCSLWPSELPWKMYDEASQFSHSITGSSGHVLAVLCDCPEMQHSVCDARAVSLRLFPSETEIQRSRINLKRVT